MAGPQSIQRFPKGLIDLLGMRATGDTPHELGQTISGELGLKDEYLFDRLQGIRASPAVAQNANGDYTFQTMTVPSGNIWYLYGLSCEATAPAAASTINLTLRIARNGLNVRNLIGPTVRMTVGESYAWGEWWQSPIILGPNETLGLFASGVTGAPNVTTTGIAWFAQVGI